MHVKMQNSPLWSAGCEQKGDRFGQENVARGKLSANGEAGRGSSQQHYNPPGPKARKKSKTQILLSKNVFIFQNIESQNITKMYRNKSTLTDLYCALHTVTFMIFPYVSKFYGYTRRRDASASEACDWWRTRKQVNVERVSIRVRLN